MIITDEQMGRIESRLLRLESETFNLRQDVSNLEHALGIANDMLNKHADAIESQSA